MKTRRALRTSGSESSITAGGYVQQSEQKITMGYISRLLLDDAVITTNPRIPMAYEKTGLHLSHIVFPHELALALPHAFSILDSS